MAKKKKVIAIDFSKSKEKAAEYSDAYRQKRAEDKTFVAPLANNKDYRTQLAKNYAEKIGMNPTTDKNKTGRENPRIATWADNLPQRNRIENAVQGPSALYKLARQTVEDGERKRTQQTRPFLDQAQRRSQRRDILADIAGRQQAPEKQGATDYRKLIAEYNAAHPNGSGQSIRRTTASEIIKSTENAQQNKEPYWTQPSKPTGNPGRRIPEEVYSLGNMSEGRQIQFERAAAASDSNPLTVAERRGRDNYGDLQYTMMTPEQKRHYNRVYGILGPEKAEEYHNMLLDEINRKIGEKTYNEDVRNRNTLEKTAYNLEEGFSSGMSGLMDFGSMLAQNTDSRARAPREYITGMVSQDPANTGLQRDIYNIATSTGNMLPGFLMSLATKNRQIGDITFGLSAGGNAYREAINNGNTKSASELYAMQQAFDEFATNELLGGIGFLGGGQVKRLLSGPAGSMVKKATERAVKTPVGRAFVNRLMNYAMDAGSEAVQEYLQFYTDNWTQAILGLKDENGNVVQANLNPLDPEALYSAQLGAMNAAVLNMPPVARRAVSAARMNPTQRADIAGTIAGLNLDGYSADDLRRVTEAGDVLNQVAGKDRPSLLDNYAVLSSAEEVLGSDSYRETAEAEAEDWRNSMMDSYAETQFGEEGRKAFNEMIAPENRSRSGDAFLDYYNAGYTGEEVSPEREQNAWRYLTPEQAEAARRAGQDDAAIDRMQDGEEEVYTAEAPETQEDPQTAIQNIAESPDSAPAENLDEQLRRLAETTQQTPEEQIQQIPEEQWQQDIQLAQDEQQVRAEQEEMALRALAEETGAEKERQRQMLFEAGKRQEKNIRELYESATMLSDEERMEALEAGNRANLEQVRAEVREENLNARRQEQQRNDLLSRGSGRDLSQSEGIGDGGIPSASGVSERTSGSLAEGARDVQAKILRYSGEESAENLIYAAEPGQKIYKVDLKGRLTDTVKRGIAIARKAGAKNVVPFASVGDIILSSGERARASYDPNTDTIYGRVNHKKFDFEQFVKHEVTERGIDKGLVNVDETVKHLSDELESAGLGELKEAIYDLAVNYVSKVDLSDPNVSEETKRTELGEAVKEMVCDAAAGINQFEALEGYEAEAEMMDLFSGIVSPYVNEKMDNVFDVDSYDIFDTVTELSYGENSYEVLEEELPGSTKAQVFSIDSITASTGLKAVRNSEGVSYAIMDPATGKELTEKDITDDLMWKSPMGVMIKASMEAKQINAKTAKAQVRYARDLMRMIIKYKDMAPVWEFSGSSLFSSIKKNADKQYGSTVDFGTICAKTQALIDVMSATMVEKQRGLTRAEVLEVYNRVAKIEKDGKKFSVPCPVCYVFSRWMGVPSLLESVRQGQERFGEKALKELGKEKLTEEVDKYVKNIEKKYNITRSEDGKLDKSKLSSAKTKLTNKAADLEAKWMKARGNTAEMEKIERQINEIEAELQDISIYNWVAFVRCKSTAKGVPILDSKGKIQLDNAYKEVPLDILFDMNRTGEYAEGYARQWLYRTTRGAGLGKAIMPYSDARLGDVIKGAAIQNPKRYGDRSHPFFTGNIERGIKDIKNAAKRMLSQNLIGGQRWQSTSDMRAEWGLDYLQTLMELQNIGGKAQLYTKVIEAVDFLASAGVEVNLSIMGKGNGYHIDENGNPVLGVEDFSSVTGINFEQALEKTKKYDNVQMILVGLNDVHIRLALADNRITFVIPWHSSGNTEDILRSLMGSVGEKLIKGTDYQNIQEDKVIDFKDEEKNAEMKAMRDLRKAIITRKIKAKEGPTKEQQRLLNKNPWLNDLYRRFYLDKNSEESKCTLSASQAEKIFPYEYWDKSLTIEDADINGQRFQEYCASLGLKPRFSGMKKDGEIVGDFTQDRGYWKLLIDRRMYNRDGTYHEAQVVDVTKVKIESVPTTVNSNRYRDQELKELAIRDAIRALDEKKNDMRIAEPGSEQEVTKTVPETLKPDIESAADDKENAKVIREGSDKDIKYSTDIFSKNISEKLKANMATFFSGSGTVDFALRSIVHHEFAVEYDAKIAAVYKANNGDNIYVDDVRNVDIDKHKGKVEYFHASPVCKSYSNANKDGGERPLDIETARATAEAINTLQPKVVTVENVARYKNSEAIKLIEDALRENGYEFDKGVYRASDFGGATIRERMFLRAVKDGVLPEIDTSEYQPMTWYDAVEDLIPELPKAELPDYMKKRMELSGINLKNLKQPIFLLGGEKSGKLTYAPATKPAPTILAKSTEARILMPGGDVLRATPRVMARIQGLPDAFDLKDGKGGMTNAYKVVGNGVPVQLTQGIVGPLLEQNLIQPKSKETGIKYSSEISIVTRAQDKEYKDAVNSGDIDKAREMVERAARAAGFTEHIYHGTESFGFKKFGLGNAKDGISIFATSDPNVAMTYSGRQGVRRIADANLIDLSKLTPKKALEILNKGEKKYELLAGEARRTEIKNQRDRIKEKIREAREEARRGDSNNGQLWRALDALSQMTKTTDPYAFAEARDAFDGAKYDVSQAAGEDSRLADILDGAEIFDATVRLETLLNEEAIFYEREKDWNDEYASKSWFTVMQELARKNRESGVYELYGKNDNMLELDAKGNNWNSIPTARLNLGKDRKGLGKTATTREIAKYAKEEGYSGVIFRNLKDNGAAGDAKNLIPSDVYVYFNSEDIRSADPITYGNNGKVISLSKRFAKEDKDLRYSSQAPLMDYEGRKYVKDLTEKYETRIKELKDRAYRQQAAQRLLRRARALQQLARRRGSLDFKAQVDKLIGDLDTVSAGMRDNTREALTALREEVMAQCALDPDYKAVFGDKYDKLFARLTQKHISEMTLPEIIELTEQIVALEHSKRTYDREILDNDARKFAEEGRKGVEQQKNIKGLNFKTEIGALIGKYKLYMLNPVRAMEMLDGYQKDGVFTRYGKMLNDGQTKAADFRMRAEKLFENLHNNDKLVRDFSKQEIEIDTMEGKKKISKGMRIALYMHLQNPDNIKHIAYGGITIPDEKQYRKGKYANAYNTGETVHFAPWNNGKGSVATMKAIREITQKMTPEEIEYAKTCNVFFNQMCKDAINETSMKLQGRELAIVDNYFPIRVNPNFLQQEMSGLTQNGTIEGMGMLKERTGALNPVLLEDVSQVVMRQTQNTSMYYGMAIPIRNFNRFYNYVSTGFETSMQQAVANTWHEAGQKYLQNLIADLQFGRQTQRNWLDSLKGLYAGTALNLNLGVAIKQSASYPFAASVIGWKPLLKAMGHTFKAADYQYMDSITPWSYMRRQGMSGTEMGEVAKQKTKIDNNKVLQKILSAFNWIQIVDVKTTNVLFAASEEYVKEQYPELKVREDAYNRKVAEVYNEMLQRTQPSYDVMQRNEFLRDKSDIMKVFGMFKTQTFNMGGEIIDAYEKWKAHAEYAKKDNSYKALAKESRKAFLNTAVATAASQMMLAVLSAVAAVVMHRMKPYRDDEGRVTPESVAGKVLADFIGSFPGMTMFGNEIWEYGTTLATGGTIYDIEYPALEIVNGIRSSTTEMATAIKKAIQTKKPADRAEAEKKMRKAAMEISKIRGIPAQNVYNIFNAFYLWGQEYFDKEGEFFDVGEGLWELADTSVTKEQYAKRAAAEYKAGNTAAGDKWAEKTTKEKLQAAMYGDQGIDEDSSKAMVEYIKAGGTKEGLEKHAKVLEEFQGEGKQKKIVDYINKQTNDREEKKRLWVLAGYQLDSTKDGKTIKNGNFDKHFD